MRIRECRGLAYTIFSFGASHSYVGEVGVYVGTRPENLVEVIDVISAELARFVADPASRGLSVPASTSRVRWPSPWSSTSGRANRLGEATLMGLPDPLHRRDARPRGSVTMADVQELAPGTLPS